MNYGKFENEKLIYAPKILKFDDYEIINPTEEQYLQTGYKKIVYVERPEDEEGFYFVSRIIDMDGIPTQEWVKCEIPKSQIE